MKNLLLLCLAGLLASCATTKPLPARSAADRSENYWQPAPVTPDSSSGPRVEPGSQADFIRRIFEGHPPVVQLELEAEADSLPFVKVPKSPQKPTEKRRLFGLLPAKKPAGASQTQLATAQNATQIPRKCKGCTFNLVAGNQIVAGKKAQVAAGDGATASVIEKKAGPAFVASDSSTQNAILGGGNIQATNGNNNTPQLTAPVQQASDWKAILAKYAGAALVLLILFIFYERRKSVSNNG